MVNHTRQRCDPEVKDVCNNISIPLFEVRQTEETGQATVQIQRCNPRVEEATYCHVFPSAECESKNVTLKRGFRINRIVCDREAERDFCINIPVMDCEKKTGP